ncbi:MAG: type II toxin-antitoxin system PemK/MazF family toxin [Candidatus Acidiferrales bacterium]
MPTNSPAPRRGEIWIANTGDPPQRHWVVIVSLDARNQSPRAQSVLAIPFGSKPAVAPTIIEFAAGETGLPGPSYLRGDLIQPLLKSRLVERLNRPLSNRRMREVCRAIQPSFDPDAPMDEGRV